MKKNTSTNNALSAGIGYMVGNILIKGINFLSVPLFSRCLSTEQFGIYNVFISYDEILYVLIGLALHSSLRSANIEFKNEINKYSSSITIIPCINLIILLLLSVVFGNVFTKWTGFARPIIYLLIIYSFGSSVLTFYNNRISLDYEYKKYLIVALLNSIGNIGLSLIFIYTIFDDYRDIGRILGATLTIFVIALFLLYSMYKIEKPKYNRTYWKFAIKYSLPIIPHGISQVLLGQVDRIMIQRIIGSSAAGIYSLAGNIKLILTVITSSISNAWSTWFYEEMGKRNIKNIQNRACQLSLLFTVFSVGLISISPELIWFLGGKEYMSGKYVAIPMIIDAFVLFLYNVIVPSEYYTKKTTYIMYGTIAAAIIDVFLNYIMIKRFGFVAAAYTTLFSYLCYLLFHIIISWKQIKFSVLPIKNMLIDLFIVGVMGAFNLVFIDNLLFRYCSCFVVVLPISIYLLYSLRKGKNFKS